MAMVQGCAEIPKGYKMNSLFPLTTADRKRIFLNSIRSSDTYKRVALSPIRYAGGKTLAVGHVVELIPDDVERVVSPFFGGGSIEIAIAKHLEIPVVGYDIFDILMNYWQHQISQPQQLYDALVELKPTKVEHERVRKMLKRVWNKELVLDPLTLAAYFVFNFNLSYGPGFMGWSSHIYLDSQRYYRMIERVKRFRAENLTVECADFRDIMAQHRDDFLYLDPPYYLDGDSKMFRGIYPMRNIPVHHEGFSHDELRDLLRQHRGGFVLSYNDCTTIREYYDGYDISTPSWQYTMGQGETRRENYIKKSHELLIKGNK